jgi:hypothetical protein
VLELKFPAKFQCVLVKFQWVLELRLRAAFQCVLFILCSQEMVSSLWTDPSRWGDPCYGSSSDKVS